VALASVKLELLTGQAERSAKRLQARTNELSNRFRDVKNRSNAAGNKIQKFGRQSATASKGVRKLGAAVKNLLVGLAVIQTARFVFFKTAELESQKKSLEVLTGSLAKTNQIIGELQAFGAVTPFTSTELIESGKRLKAFGVDTEKLVSVTKQLSDVAGAVGKPLGEVVAVYGKIQAKGRMTMEELLQFQERGINVTDELSRLTGLYGNDLMKAMSQGKLGAELVEQAFINLTKESGLYFEGAINQAGTLNGKWSTFIDGVDTLARSIGEKLQPVLKETLEIAISLVNRINQSIAAGSITDIDKKAFKKQAEGIVREQAGFMPGGPFGMGEIKVDFQGQEFKGQPSAVQSQITNALINAEVSKRLKEQLDLQLKLEQQNQKNLKTVKDIKTTKEGINKTDNDINNKNENLNKALELQKVKWETIKETIASGLTSAVEGLIAGTKTLGESLAGIAKSIASMYLKAAFMNMLPGLPTGAEGAFVSNGIKPFAAGGMATKPTLGLIGEAGEDEYVIPASKMASSMQRYSAGARGEAVIPGTGSSHAGGGAGGSTTVNYSGPILNFNSEEFVPKSAVGQIIATATSQGARAGENRTLSTLRNSRSARSRLGM